MFCCKCGTQIADDAKICHKCGAKAAYVDRQSHVTDIPQAAAESESTSVVEPIQQGPVQSTAQAEDSISDKADFKTFVDNHVRKTTEFQSAVELLKSTPPIGFVVMLCVGIPVLVAFVAFVSSGNLMGALALSLVSLGVGYLAALFVATMKKGRCGFRYKGMIEDEIDTDDLIRFLNAYLDYLQPHFHEWGYVQRRALSVAGAVQLALTEGAKEITICTSFGEDQRRISEIIIHAAPSDRDSGKKEYFVDAENRLEGYSFLSHDNGFQKYKCVVRTAPILQAAMEYYLHHYKNHEGR